MKTLQERMNDMKPYFRGIEMYNEALMVKVCYPNNWKAYPSEDGRIKVTPSEDTPNLTYYYADSQDTTYDDMFDLIEATIKANNEILLKVKLLRDKVEELKQLFSILPYEELATLEFKTTPTKKEKPKRKYTKSSKKDDKNDKEEKTEVEEVVNNEEVKVEEECKV